MAYTRLSRRDEKPSPGFTMVWAPVIRAMVQAGATGRERAVPVALMRFQGNDPVGLLHMGTHQLSRLTGLTEDSVRQALSSLTRRRYLLADGHEMPIIRIFKHASRGNPATYQLWVSREEPIESLRVLSPKEAEALREQGRIIPRDDSGTPRPLKKTPKRDA